MTTPSLLELARDRAKRGEEVWVPINGTDGHYDISNMGNVRGHWFNRLAKRPSPRPLKAAVATNGYRFVGITVGGKFKSVYIAHLVLEHFAGPRPAGFEASHLNGDKGNNSVSNLDWESKSQNARRKNEHGTQARIHCKLNDEDIRSILEQHQGGATFTEISKKFNVCRRTISSVCRGLTYHSETQLARELAAQEATE